MADITGLSGWRYALDKITGMADVTVPPYDVISPAEQAAYQAKDPHNFIRLELSQDEPELGLDRYQSAARTLEAWLRDKVLMQEEMPALYFYEQVFTAGGQKHRRLGFLSLVRLEPWSAGVILPHERTLAKPKADRLSLMEATGAQLSPVFGIYEDDGDLAQLVRGATQGQPNYEFTDEDGVEHRVWIRSASSLIHEIREALQARAVIIADGHHRYETALAYRDGLMAQSELPMDHPARFVMMMLVSMADPGLVVLPTHRLVHGLSADVLQNLTERLAKHWDVKEVPAAELAAALNAETAPGVFGLVLPQGSYVIAVRDWAPVDEALAAQSPAYRRLDVAILHRVIFETLLGITQEAQAAQTNLRYVKDADEAIQAVANGETQAAFLLRSTPVEELRDVAKAGEVMPQKSTYFYPKIRSGLVFHGLRPLG